MIPIFSLHDQCSEYGVKIFYDFAARSPYSRVDDFHLVEKEDKANWDDNRKGGN